MHPCAAFMEENATTERGRMHRGELWQEQGCALPVASVWALRVVLGLGFGLTVVCSAVPLSDRALGDRAERDPVHPGRVLHHPQDQSHWGHHPDCQPQPRRAQRRLRHQIQHCQWRSGHFLLYYYYLFLVPTLKIPISVFISQGSVPRAVVSLNGASDALLPSFPGVPLPGGYSQPRSLLYS